MTILLPQSPISLSRVITQDGFTLEAQAESLSQETFIKIIDNVSGEEMIIPSRFASMLLTQGHGLLTEAEGRKTQSRMLEFHPTKYFKDLVAVATVGFHHRLILKDTNALSEGTPILSWHSGAGSHYAIKGYGKSQIETTVDEQGWKLSLAGAENIGLAFAKWDDVDGIAKLIEAMGNQVSLEVMVALKNPQEAAILAARKTARDLREARVLPSIKAPIIRKLINDNLLMGRGNSSRGRLTLLTLSVEGTEIPVALAVERPMVPVFTEVISDRRNSQYYQNVEKSKEKAQVEWERKFRTLITELGDDWRFIDLPLPSNRGSSQVRLPTLWLTRINEETWSSIEPAAIMATKTFRLGGMRF